MKRGLGRVAVILWAACAIAWGTTKYGSWLQHVPDADRKRTNPHAGQSEAIAAGSKMFADHCAKCHGADALGSKKRPNLRAPEVQQATDGEIFWAPPNLSAAPPIPTTPTMPTSASGIFI